ncbi:MAG: N-acetylglucosamine-6-phosphate deacetylase [Clostridia bacterium]|nr:N-acetylglucosamine-6-phosphate deacetylase [Clostridia bacterium]
MILRNGCVVTPFEILRKADVKIEDGYITEIGNVTESAGETIYDMHGAYICPGFVDIHTHGGFGGDFMDATDESFDNALRFHGVYGTTSVVPTSVTAPFEQIEAMLNTVRRYRSQTPKTCRVLGAHLEGPYLSMKNKGAQKQEFIRVPARDGYAIFTENADIIIRATIAPELEGAAEMTKALTEKGIVVFGGHDDGERDLIMPVVDAGLAGCTHWYCAMSVAAMRNQVRSVGLMEIGLIDDRLTLELIADNHHLPPELVRLAYRCKGAEKICLVSDCLRAGGMPIDGKLYSLGLLGDETAQRFKVADGVAVLPDGTRYAGSIQPLSQMVRNLVLDCNVPMVDAVRMASLTPATVVGMQDCIGSVAVGKYADLCILDSNLQVVNTMVNGQFLS